MLDPFRKKSSVLSRFFGRGGPPGLAFPKPEPEVAPERASCPLPRKMAG